MAVGKPLTDIFRIVAEDTRSAVENPVDRVLRENIVVGLANHTVLIAKDGTERPIDDSGAPIMQEEWEDQLVLSSYSATSLTVGGQRQSRHGWRRSWSRPTTRSSARVSTVSSPRGTPVPNESSVTLTRRSLAVRSMFSSRPIAAMKSRTCWRSCKRGEQVNQFESVRITKDGRSIDVSLTISPIRDSSGRIIGASKIARDITERRRLEQELQRRLAELAEADRRKDEFLAMLAHELRNPLAAFSSAVQLTTRTVDPRPA